MERIFGFVLSFFWAHVRILTKHPGMRPWVSSWISRIRKVYGLGKEPENRINNLDALGSNLAFMKQEAEKDLHQSLPSPAIKAVKSLTRHREGLTLFLDLPEVPLNNNATGRDLRREVVGRKTFHGAGSLWSANIASWITTIFGHMVEKRDQHSHLPHRLSHCMRRVGHGPRQSLSVAPLVHGLGPEGFSLPANVRRHLLIPSRSPDRPVSLHCPPRKASLASFVSPPHIPPRRSKTYEPSVIFESMNDPLERLQEKKGELECSRSYQS